MPVRSHSLNVSPIQTNPPVALSEILGFPFSSSDLCVYGIILLETTSKIRSVCEWDCACLCLLKCMRSKRKLDHRPKKESVEFFWSFLLRLSIKKSIHYSSAPVLTQILLIGLF